MAGVLETHVLLAVFNKHRQLMSGGVLPSQHLTPRQARSALQEAADIAGVKLSSALYLHPPGNGADSREQKSGASPLDQLGGAAALPAWSTSPYATTASRPHPRSSLGGAPEVQPLMTQSADRKSGSPVRFHGSVPFLIWT